MKLRDRRNSQLGMNGKLPTLPGVSSLSMATRYIDGGRDRFIEMVQLAAGHGVEEAIKFMVVFADLLPGERQRVSFDDVCAAAGVSQFGLMGKIVSIAMEFGQQVADAVAASFHPAVVHQAGRSAKRIGGQHAAVAQRDREMLFQHHGFIPLPRGQSIHVHASAAASSQASAAAAADPSVPSFADTMAALRTPRNTIQTRLIEAHQVTAAEQLLEDIDATAVREPVIVRTGEER